MAKANLINKDSLVSLLESTTDTVVKSLDELDLFKYDGLLSTLPFGKMFSFFGKKVIQIKNLEEALNKSIYTTSFIAFLDGLRKYSVNPVVEEVFLKEDLLAMKETKAKKKFGYVTFDINSFNKNSIVKFSQKILIDFSERYLSKSDHARIRKHLRDYHKQFFLKLLEENKLTFEKLSEYFSKESYEEIIVNIKKDTYKESLANQYFEIILNDPNNLKLSDIYLEPQFNIHKNCIQEKENKVKKPSSFDDKGFIHLNSESVHEFVFKFLQGKQLSELKQTNSNILFILGYPGQGKSSFCKKLLYDSIKGERILDRDIYFIKFRNITNTSDLIYSPINTLFEHIADQLDFEISKNDFKNSILILDGLDELFMKENLQFSSIDEFCRVLIRDIESNELPKIIITSRYGYINTERLKTENAIIVQLQEFDLEKQKKWLRIYSRFHPETQLSEEKLIEINNDTNYFYLKELINQPILLHLIATLNEEIDINTNRAKIYENLFTQLIERNWAREGQIDNLVGINQNDLREFIREIAFAIFLSANEYINKSTIVNLPSTKAFLQKLQNQELQDSLKRIMIAFYFQDVKRAEKDEIKEDKNDYAIEFLHKSLQEYLVAEKIWNSTISFTDKNTRTGKFNINDEKAAFEVINNLFARKFISKEISNYIIEIIRNDISIDKEILTVRLEKYLPDFLEVDFLYKNEISSDKNIIIGALSNFYGYWLLISNLGAQRNLIPTDHKEKFAFFLRLFSRETAGFNLSFQNLSGANLEGVKLTHSNLSHCNFSSSNLTGADLSSADLSYTNFEKADLYRATLEYAKLKETNFENSQLISAILYNLDLRNSHFEGAELKGAILAAANIEGVSFDDCDMDYTNLLNTKGQKYDNFKGAIIDLDSCLGLLDSIKSKIKKSAK